MGDRTPCAIGAGQRGTWVAHEGENGTLASLLLRLGLKRSGETMIIQEALDPDNQEIHPPDSPAYRQTPWHAARVLVVDDEPHILDFLSSMLEDEGFDVIRAENAYQGFEKAQREHPDLVISDVMMPGATGIDLYSWLQQVNPMPHVVFMSAVSRRSPAPQVPLLEKPFDIDDMLDLVESVMSRAS